MFQEINESQLARAVASALRSIQSTPPLDTPVLIGEYLEQRRSSMRHSYWKANNLYLNRWDKKLNRKDIIVHLAKVHSENGPIAARAARMAISGFCSWLITNSHLEDNPAKSTIRTKLKSRDRVLSLQEIKFIWNACDDSNYSRIIKLLILSLCRKSEIGSLQHSDVILNDEVKGPHLIIPADRSKNHRLHMIPLTPMMRDLLPKERKGFNFLFGRTRNAGFSGWGKAKQELDTAVGFSDYVVHDIRRSGATHLAESGFDPDLIELTLNHITGRNGVKGVYNRSVRWTARREMAEAWSNMVELAVS